MRVGLRYTKDVFEFSRRDVCWMCDEWEEVSASDSLCGRTYRCVCVRLQVKFEWRLGQTIMDCHGQPVVPKKMPKYVIAVASRAKFDAIPVATLARTQVLTKIARPRSVFLHLKFDGFIARAMDRGVRHIPRNGPNPPRSLLQNTFDG